ncbi:MAG: paraquat-inducible protein [Planctomycetota bacterium]|nr:MAG: paraquat-inducible protein [Planctomycetota bacterium]
MTSARAEHLARCHACGLATQLPACPPGHSLHCPRCDSELHLRKPHSLSRTWALLIAAYLMYIPANLLPVSTIVYMGNGEPDTIISGVMYLFKNGDAPVALLLFIASIAVPFMKLVVLTWLTLCVKFKVRWRPRDRTVIYRVVEGIGRWSMLDIFVIALLVAMVQLQALATIHAGPGAVAFCSVVVLTMFAAESFDPRLMWDSFEES